MLLVQKQDMLHTHGSVFYSKYMSRKEGREGGKEEGRKEERKEDYYYSCSVLSHCLYTRVANKVSSFLYNSLVTKP